MHAAHRATWNRRLNTWPAYRATHPPLRPSGATPLGVIGVGLYKICVHLGRSFRSVTKLTTKVRIGRGYLWGSFLIAAAALKTPTRNGYNPEGVNLNFCVCKNPSSLFNPRPFTWRTLLQYYCATMASPDPPFVCHTLYSIGNEIIVSRLILG